MIVLHHSGTDDGPEVNWVGIWKYHVEHNGWLSIGYHGGCEKMGDQYVGVFGRSWFWDGAHTFGYNDRALGLCMVGNFMLAAPTPDQLKKAAEICATWMRVFNIAVNQIFMHKELNATDCPGAMFNKKEFIETYLVDALPV
jgi:hypothetical protein